MAPRSPRPGSERHPLAPQAQPDRGHPSVHSTPASTGKPVGLRLLILAAAAAATLLVAAPAAPVAATSTATPAERVVEAARSHLGAPYVWGSTGPRTFDCSGLVYRVFADVGLLSRIGGNRGGYGLYDWFVSRHEASRSHPEVGDLVAYGYGSHVGIYIGHGMAISALISGVSLHGVFALTTPFTAYLHTHLADLVAETPRQRASAPATPRTTAKAATAKAATTRVATVKVRWATTTLLVRAGPSTDRPWVAVVLPNARLVVLRSARDPAHRVWYEVRLASSRHGWVAGWLTRT